MKPTCHLIWMKFDLCQECFYFTAFSFLQKLQMSWYDSVASDWLSSQSDMQTWPQYSFPARHSCPFPFERRGGCASTPHFWSPVHRTAANLCPRGFLLKHGESGSNGRHRWLRQNETQVEGLNIYNKGNSPKHLNFKEDLGPQKAFVVQEPKNLLILSDRICFYLGQEDKLMLILSPSSSSGHYFLWEGFGAFFLQRVSKLTSC